MLRLCSGCGQAVTIYIYIIIHLIIIIFFVGERGEVGDPYFFLHISSNWVKIRLHTENELTMLSGSAYFAKFLNPFKEKSNGGRKKKDRKINSKNSGLTKLLRWSNPLRPDQ